MKKSFTWEVNIQSYDEYYYSEDFFLPFDEKISFNMGICFERQQDPFFKILVQKGYRGKARATIIVTVENAAISHCKHIADWEHKVVFPKTSVPKNETVYGRNNAVMAVVTLPYRMTVNCEISWYGFVDCCLEPHRNLLQYAMNPELSDFIIQVEDTEFPVHKLILAAHSSVFQRIFLTDMKEKTENRIIIPDVTVKAMEKLLTYLYRGSIDALSDYNVAVQLLVLAEKYEIPDLKKLCSGALIEHLNVANVLDILDIADLHQADELWKFISKFMVKHQAKIIKLPKFEAFIATKPQFMRQFLMELLADNNGQSTTQYLFCIPSKSPPTLNLFFRAVCQSVYDIQFF